MRKLQAILNIICSNDFVVLTTNPDGESYSVRSDVNDSLENLAMVGYYEIKQENNNKKLDSKWQNC